MAQTFDQIPSVIEIPLEEPKKTATVAEELEAAKELLNERKTKCRIILPLNRTPRKRQLLYSYKFFCVCPKYNPSYCCKHTGNIIIDRDVLTKEEHICYLSTPKGNLAAPRKLPHYYHKKAIVPNCTSRIETLALPKLKRVEENLEVYNHLLNERQQRALEQHLAEKPEVQYTTIVMALDYIEEERRLQRVARNMEKRRCKRIRKNIKRKQRRQIRKIICVLFEEMRDFLLNDQFLIDERSTLCAVILEQIREFTDKEFYTTSNLREYQQTLANNLTVWINKFISNLNIHVAPPPQRIERLEPETFLPVHDYISCSTSYEGAEEEEECDEEEYELFPIDSADAEENDYRFLETDPATDNTLRNTDP